MANQRIGVILSGCGVYDGTEIHEATLTLLALDRRHAQVQCFAPDIDQAQVIDHVTGEPSTGTRSALLRSTC